MKNDLPASLDGVCERRRLLLALAGSGALAACGGGVSDVPPAETLSQPLGVGAGGTGLRWNSLITGPVSRLRPVAVGSVLLNTSKAVLTDGDGVRLSDSDLDIGMTARVLAGPIAAGLAPNGTSVAQAQSLVVDTQLRGAAQRLDARTLRLLEQRVTLNARTLYGPGVDLLASDLPLRVWGQLDLAGGRIVATRIALMAAGDSTMLRGLLGALDPVTGQLQIGALAARPVNPAVVPAALRPGAVVRAVLGARGADGVWELLAVRDDALRLPDNVSALLQGRVTRFDSAASFALDGVPVDATAATVEGAAYLGLGAAVEVSGMARRGVLVAREVHAEAPEPVEFAGRLVACDASQQLMTVAGLQVHWSASTVFTQGSARDLHVGCLVAGVGLWGPGEISLEATRLQIGN
jgi:hypothetical protein